MNLKTVFIAIVILISLGMIVSSTELVFEQEYCVVGNDCTLNDLFLTGNFSFVGDIVNVTIINQEVVGQLSVIGNISADYFIGDGSLLTGLDITGQLLWNQTGDNMFPSKITSSIGIGTTTPIEKLTVIGNASIGNTQVKNLTIENTIRSSKNNSFIEITNRGDVLIWI